MANFKYRERQIVYYQKNQKRGIILRRQTVVSTNCYLVRFDDNDSKLWICEDDLDDKSLSEKLFAIGGYASPSFSMEYESRWFSPVSPIAGINQIDTPYKIVSFKSITGMEAVNLILSLNEKIADLEYDVENVRSDIARNAIKNEIEKLRTERDNITKELNSIRIMHKKVEQGDDICERI